MVVSTSEMIARKDMLDTNVSTKDLKTKENAPSSTPKRKSKPDKRVCRWRRRSKPVTSTSYAKELTLPTNEDMEKWK